MAKRSKKININMMKAGKVFIVGIFSLFILFLIYNRGVYLLEHSDLFKVKEIVKGPSLQFVQSRHLEKLIGHSMFAIDLKSVQKQLMAQYPQIDRLRISREFPGRIYLSAQKRYPFAAVIVKGSNVVVDDKGVILSINDAIKDKLPSINGVMLTANISVGKSVISTGLEVAINIIKIVQESEYLSSKEIDLIDVTNLSKIHFYLTSGFNIIIDQYHLQQNIKKLGILLSEGNIDKKEVGYIDLRFKEPILGKK